MGLFDKLERGLERAVKQPFARVFKAEVQPVEIASAMRRSMDDRAAVLGPGRTMVPNVFTVELADTDYERLTSYEHALTDELVAAAEDHADAQRYVAPGPFEVRFAPGEDLETGIFRVRTAARDGRRGGPAQEHRDPRRPEDRSRGPADDRPHRRDEEPHHRQGASRPAHAEDPDAAYRRPEPGARTAPDHDDDRRPRRPRPGRAPVSLEMGGHRVPLPSAVSTLGRDESCTVVVDDAGASRRHAEVRISHDGPHLQVVLRDLGSTNGTYLNGEQVSSEVLRHGDRITLGRTHLTVRVEG